VGRGILLRALSIEFAGKDFVQAFVVFAVLFSLYFLLPLYKWMPKHPLWRHTWQSVLISIISAFTFVTGR